MTEQEWLNSTDPQAMLEALDKGELGGKKGHLWYAPGSPQYNRKLRLFACGLCRLVWGRITDPRSRRAVETAERYAEEGEAVAKEMGRAWLYLDMEAPHEPAWMFAYLACCPPDTFLRDLANSAFSAPDMIPPAAQADLLRCVTGNPFRPWMREDDFAIGKPMPGKKINILWLSWLTPDALALARTAYTDRDWSLLPILADAMEDSGCDSADLLTHLRGSGPHCRGCWAVDLILGKE